MLVQVPQVRIRNGGHLPRANRRVRNDVKHAPLFRGPVPDQAYSSDVVLQTSRSLLGRRKRDRVEFIAIERVLLLPTSTP